MSKDLYYVCSPLGAPTKEEIRANMLKARKYMEWVSKRYNCRAIAPHAILPEYLDDHNPEERELGLKFGMDLLTICKKLVVCGNSISSGMCAEIALAKKLGIEIIYPEELKTPKITITIEIEGD